MKVKVGDLVRVRPRTYVCQRGIVLECLTDDYWGATVRVRFEDSRVIEIECDYLEVISENR